MAARHVSPHPLTGKSKIARRKTYPTVDVLRNELLYNPCIGSFIWRPRPEINGFNIRHNRWYAGKVAGTLHPDGYIIIGIHRKMYSAHRLAWIWWYGYNPEEEIDHINRCRSENRIDNLRLVSLSEQARNKGMYKNNKSGIRGVHYYKRSDNWVAKIVICGKLNHIGYFATKEEAGEAYLRAKERLWKT